MNPLIVIPARMASTRLPGKPLAEINGRPMIAHVVERALQADLGPVVVAAAEPEIAAAAERAGATAILTDPDLPSGSDRVWQAARSFDPHERHDVIVNLQGDLPTFPPTGLRLAASVVSSSTFDVGTLVSRIRDRDELDAQQVVKVACAFRSGSDESEVARALYFSRAVVPWGEGPHWHHIGVYAWKRSALAEFMALDVSVLEARESLEQLRALEAGMSIGCARIEQAPFGVDTPADLERARKAMSV